MAHMVSAGESQTAREPSSQMDSPVDFFGRNQIHAPANENTGSDPKVEQDIDNNNQDSVDGK